ncbi:hypothetical protein [Streptomyces sp. NPDC093109]|uniref:hypothetical protein n=1 Tax=Streptomyces sp. NPDC093109 TaxID=3154977 RepID=UPI00344DD41D
MRIATAQFACVPADVTANVRRMAALAGELVTTYRKHNHAGPAGPWTGCGRSAVWAPGGGLLAEADTDTVVVAEIGQGHGSTR